MAATPQSSRIVIEHGLQIPGEILPAGTYLFSLEDRLTDRAIVRIENAADGRHTLLLSVPSSRMGGRAANRLILFGRQGAQEVLRGWMCPACTKPLEFVYSKEEAVKITANTGQSVLAADAAYDKLPANLSADDMKVVTLWLLSPERVLNERGVGLTATKYMSAATAMAPALTRGELPETASNTYSWAAAGVALLLASGFMRLGRFGKGRCAS